MKLLQLYASVSIFFGITTATLTGDPPSDPYSCSPSKQCKIGCCGKNNVCGLGPDYCAAENCTSTCTAKSDCDPGWGAQWSNKEKCPLNVCCSKFGFCGTTSEFCGTATVKSPSCSGNSASQKIIGYYEGWSSTRSCRGMFPENLLSAAYTHLNYAFAFIDPGTFAVAPMAELDKELYPRFTGLKQVNPGLQTWISVGGWSMNDPDQPTHATFSILAGSPDAQSKFFSSLVNFMSTYGFDGVDIDWEYPVAPERSGNTADFANYVSFLKNLKNALGSGGHNYGLTITLPSSYWYMQNFDIKALESVVDWFNMMTYDLHGTWDSTDPYIGAVVNAHTNLTEIEQTLDLLWRNDIDPKKVVMGMGFYGRSFTLSDPKCNKAGCPFSAGGSPGPCSASAGTLMYSEIEDIIAAGATVVKDNDAGVAIVNWDHDQWVSYDDGDTLKQKMDFANGKCLGGVMIWAASTDDSSGTAIQALTGAAGRPALSQASLFGWPKKPVGQCVWGECGADCPSGLTPATGTGGKVSGYAGIFNGCDKDKSRYYCCPTDSAPKCEWKGQAPFCGATSGGRCSGNQVEVTTSTSGTGKSCWTGHKSLCCSHTDADTSIDQCKWYGAAPFCVTQGVLLSPLNFFDSYQCPSDHPDKLTTGKYGAGGEQPCLYDAGWKSYCCKDPVPFANCAWHQGREHTWSEWAQSWIAGGLLNGLTAPLFATDCKGQCPAGQVPIATDATNCQAGTYSYFCCDNPNAPALPAPGDVAMCPAPATPIGGNSGSDPDGRSPNIFAESNTFDSDCTLYATSGNQARDLDWVLQSRWDDSFDANETDSIEGRALWKRGSRDGNAVMKLCYGGQSVPLTPQTYSGYRTVAALANKGWIHIAKPLVCGAIGLAISSSEPPGEDFVTEHVFEKQQLRNAIQYMAQGKLPGGGTLAAGAAQFQGIFDAGGKLFQNWPSTLAQAYGATPEDTAFGLLGHTAPTANYDNLQVLDRGLNGLKAFIVAGKDFVSDGNWKALSDLDKLNILQDTIDVFNYMKLPQVTQSFATTYNGLLTMWNNFASIPGTQAGYDYAGAFKDIITADLNSQQSLTKSRFKNLVNAQLTYWASSQAALAHTKPVVDAAKAALADFAKNADTYINLDVTSLLKKS